MIRALLLALSFVALAFSQDTSSAPIDPAKKAAIHHLLESMHTTQLMRSQMELVLPSLIKLLKANPSVTEKFADEFGRRFISDLSTDDMEAMVIQTYADQFSLAEIKDLIVFYDSPAGKKLVEVQPHIMAELGPKLQVYGAKLGRDTATKIAEEHPDYIKSNSADKSSAPAATPPPEL